MLLTSWMQACGTAMASWRLDVASSGAKLGQQKCCMFKFHAKISSLHGVVRTYRALTVKQYNDLQLDVKTRMQAAATRAHLFCSNRPGPSGACADDTWQNGHVIFFFW